MYTTRHGVQRFNWFRSDGVAHDHRRAILLGACLLFYLMLSGCATRMEIVEPGTPVELREDEGLLIVHVDTDVHLKRISIRSGTVATELPEGDHLWIVRARAGNSGWRRVDFGKEVGRRAYIFVEQWDGLNENEFKFDIKAGRINYPGALIVRSKKSEPGWPRGWISVRNRNHSAMAIRRLLKEHPVLLESLPIRFGGSSGDEFLKFYTTERDRVSSDLERGTN